MWSPSPDACHIPINTISMIAYTSFPPCHLLFCSASLAHIAMYWCLLFRTSQGAKISHFGQHRRGWFPSFRTINMHCTCWWKKWTWGSSESWTSSGTLLLGIWCCMLLKGRRSYRWCKSVCICAREIILARNILHHAKAWCWVPLWLLFL